MTRDYEAIHTRLDAAKINLIRLDVNKSQYSEREYRVGVKAQRAIIEVLRAELRDHSDRFADAWDSLMMREHNGDIRTYELYGIAL